MTGKEMVPWGTAIVGDVLSALQVPGSGFFGKLGDKYLERKQREAAEILIEEVSKGSPEPINFTDGDTDPLIEIIYRFSKAAADGAARENLRLLAQVIAGLKRNKALQSDKFRKWANVLEQLTRDELLVIGKAIATKRELEANPSTSFWRRLKEELAISGYQEAEAGSLCASLTRTGLLLPSSGWGELVYRPTPWLDELASLADVEGVTTSQARQPG
jgi:hypothetical protein